MTDNYNEVKIEMEGKKTTLTVRSNGHPLDDLIKKLFKGLNESGLVKHD